MTTKTIAGIFTDASDVNKADIRNNMNSVCPSISELKGISGGVAPVKMTGYYALGDGGNGAWYRYASGQPAGTYVDNGGSIIVPTAGDGSEAWIFPEIGIANVKQFGAKGDGTTDDSTAIQAAADSLTDGGRLYFPPSADPYSVSTYIEITNDNVEICGHGWASCVQFDNSSDPYDDLSSRVGIFNLRANGITMHHLKVDQNFRGSGRTDAGGLGALIACIILGGQYDSDATVYENINIHDCIIYDYYGDGISSFVVETDKVQVTNCFCISTYIVQSWTTAGDTGEQAISLSGGDYQIVTDNIVLGSLDDGIAVHGAGVSSNIIVSNNVMTTTGGRILVVGLQSGSIVGNSVSYIDGSTDEGASAWWISFDASAATLRQNNTVIIANNSTYLPTGVVLTNSAMRLYSPGKNLMVTGNVFFSEDAQTIAGIEIRDRQWTGGDSNWYGGENISITNNQIRNFGFGITHVSNTESGDYIVIRNNIFVDCTIGISTTGALVGHNTYIGCTYPLNNTNQSWDYIIKDEFNKKEFYIANTSDFSSAVYAEQFSGISNWLNIDDVQIVGVHVSFPHTAPNQNLTFTARDVSGAADLFTDIIPASTTSMEIVFTPDVVSGDDQTAFSLTDVATANTATIDVVITVYYISMDAA